MAIKYGQVEFLLSGVKDDTGEPLAGAKVYSYEAGTTTAKPLYSDINETFLPNPFLLDEGGRRKCFAYGNYKIQVKVVNDDETETTVLDYDNLSYGYNDSSNSLFCSVSTYSDVGSVRTFNVSSDEFLSEFNSGLTIKFIADSAPISGDNRLSISGSTAIVIKDINGANLTTASWSSGDTVECVYDNDTFTLLTSSIAAGSITATDLSSSIVSSTGAILGGGGTTLSINTDGSTVEISSNALRIKDGGITTAKIADGAVTTSKIVNSSITTGKIADSAVTTAKIADSNVTTAKIANGNVTTAKIANNNVTYAKIPTSMWGTGLSVSGSAVNASIDNSTIKFNGSGQMYVDPAAINYGSLNFNVKTYTTSSNFTSYYNILNPTSAGVVFYFAHNNGAVQNGVPMFVVNDSDYYVTLDFSANGGVVSTKTSNTARATYGTGRMYRYSCAAFIRNGNVWYYICGDYNFGTFS